MKKRNPYQKSAETLHIENKTKTHTQRCIHWDDMQIFKGYG